MVESHELGIKGTLDIDDIIEGLKGLIDLIGEIPGEVSTNLNVGGLDELNAEAKETELTVQQIGEAAANSNVSLDGVNQSLSEAAESLGGFNADVWRDISTESGAASESIQGAGIATDGFNTELSGIDVNAFNAISTGAQDASSDLSAVGDSASSASIDFQSIVEAASNASGGLGLLNQTVSETSNETTNASNETSGLASALGLVEGAASALIGLAVAEWLSNAIQLAGAFSDSSLRMAVALGESGTEAANVQSEWSGAITEMTSETERGITSVKSFITNMALAGVESQNLVISSFYAVSGAAFEAGVSVDSLGATFAGVVQYPTRLAMALKTMKINSEDVFNATGMSVTELTAKFKELSPTARAEMLETIINFKYGQNAVEAYKISYEHLTDALGRAYTAISRIIGSFILPIAIPAIEVMTGALEWFADGLKSLDPTVQGIIGVLTLLVGGFTAVVLIVKPLWALILPLIESLLGLESGAGAAAVAAELFGVSLGPLGWSILAILAIIGAAITIWSLWSDEIIRFKDALMSGDWGSAITMIGDSFNYIGPMVWNALVGLGQYIWNFFAGLPAMLGNAESAYLDFGLKMVDWIINGLESAADALIIIMTKMLQDTGEGAVEGAAAAGESTGNAMVDGFGAWLETNWPKIKEILTRLFMELIPLLIEVLLLIMAIVGGTLFDMAVQAGTQFILGWVQWLAQLPVVTLALFVSFFTTMLWWALQVPIYAAMAGSQLLWGFISYVSQLPGIAWGYFLAFLNYLGQLPGIAYSYAASTGSSIVSAIGSYLSSLPGHMYSWGMNALSSFINGIIDSIPGLRSALDTVRSLFPNSPPKEGPLSKITYTTMYDWLSGIMGAGMDAVATFDLSKINTSLPDISGASFPGVVTTSDSSSKQEIEVTVKEEHTFRFEDVPENVDTEGMEAMFREYLKSREGKTVLDEIYGEIFFENKRSNGG